MTQIKISIDDDLKKEVDNILDEIGLSMSSTILIYLKKIARERRIPFALSVDTFYSHENQIRLHQSIAQIENGGGTIHEI